MSKPRLLDLFCKAGGAARGYQQAGFEVIGVDIEPQPNYAGDKFFHADALALVQDRFAGCWHEDYKKSQLRGMLGRCMGHFDAVHASPPRQGYSDLAHRTGREYPMLIERVRELLQGWGLPYVIENVEGAPLIDPVMLCGTMFPGLRVLRHRLFESNVPMTQPSHGRHPLVFTHDKRKAHYGKLDQDTAFVQVTGGGNCSVKNAAEAMGIDWMTKAELNEAIPPAYTEWVGRRLMGVIDPSLEMAA